MLARSRPIQTPIGWRPDEDIITRRRPFPVNTQVALPPQHGAFMSLVARVRMHRKVAAIQVILTVAVSDTSSNQLRVHS